MTRLKLIPEKILIFNEKRVEVLKLFEPILKGSVGGIISTVYAVISIVSANFTPPCYVSAFQDHFEHLANTTNTTWFQ